MKKLSDYQGSEAVDLWADLLDPLSVIFSDKQVEQLFRNSRSPLIMAKALIKLHSKEVCEILLRIDPEPINGLNIVVRLVEVIGELGQSSELSSFFGFAGAVMTENESFGSATENTEDAEN